MSHHTHTPGPWHLFPSNRLCIEAADGNVGLCNLARCNYFDAQLIASAPDLLDMLQRAEFWLSTCPDGRAMQLQCQAVILKAIGEQP